MERIKEGHLQNTCEVEIIFKENAYEENEEIHMEDLEQPLLSSKTHNLKFTTLWRK